jgi:ABC-2 type transport system permease protein
MQIAHVARALRALTTRELTKFVQQRGRLLSALVRPLVWLIALGAGFYNVFGLSIVPPYKTYTLYQEYMVPGLLGIILLFHGMQSSLSMVYDREMGVMRLLLTAPLPRWILLSCKLIAGTALSVITCYVFLLICAVPVITCDYFPAICDYIPAFGVTFAPVYWLTMLPALILSGLMLGALGLFLSVHIGQLENFASTMNFVIFPMFFFSTALYPLWKLEQSGSLVLYFVAQANPFTHAVELIRFALYGEFNLMAAEVVCAATAAFFMLAVFGYNPQRGVIRRAPQPA